ncbi:MAG: response regulator [Planctomycetota bacterium]|jgi:CheY-like chemotaxis protein
MKEKRTVVCFIDDDSDEVEAFERVFGADFKVVADTTPQRVLDELKRTKLKANLFVLDLYFAKGKASSEQERNRMVELKEEVDKAQKRLSDYLSEIKQSRDGGIEIMKYIRDNYPTTPIVFYTRKGSLEDAVVCMDKGADGVLAKAAPPQFDSKADRLKQIEQAARDCHDALAMRFFCKASTSNVMKKVIRLCNYVWKNCKKF